MSDHRTRTAEHWRASEPGDIESEHAIYAADAILDHPRSGERFPGRATIAARRGAGGHAPFPAPASRAALAEPIPGSDR